MDDVSLTQNDPATLLASWVERYNAGARTGDYQGFVGSFTDDGVLDYEGVPDWGPFEGRTAIAAHYRDEAPDDEIRITRWRREGGRIVAEFRLKDIPEARGGDFVIVPSGDRIARLTIAYGGPNTRWRDG